MKNLKLEYSEEKLSHKDYNTFTKKYDLKLPASYKEFILNQNGGTPNLTDYLDPFEDGFRITLFYCIRENPGSFLTNRGRLINSGTLIETHQLKEKNLSENFYPFGQDQGGSAFCISMDANEFGAIYKFYWDGSDPSYVCSSFEEFLNGLHE